MGDLDGKVAIVTGGARGLGRVEAIDLARQGARVVVNDLGVAADGTGRDESAAMAVVDEIRAFGGEAVTHFGDVASWSDAQGLIRTAIERFGDLHVLVNPADGRPADGDDAGAEKEVRPGQPGLRPQTAVRRGETG